MQRERRRRRRGDTRDAYRERDEWLLQSHRSKMPQDQTSEPPAFVRAANRWWDRLLDVADKRSFEGGASEYAPNQTTRDYVLNTIGLGAWGALFPILSIVATQLAGAEQAGMFSMAFTTATLMLYV